MRASVGVSALVVSAVAVLGLLFYAERQYRPLTAAQNLLVGTRVAAIHSPGATPGVSLVDAAPTAVATPPVSANVPTATPTAYQQPSIASLKNDIVPPGGLVNTFTGDMGYAKRDLETQDDGPGIVFARSYNSSDTRVTPLGPGWTFNYDIRITSPGYGTRDVTLTGPQGRADRHQYRPDGTFAPRLGVPITLKRNSDSTYVAVHDDGVRWAFDSSGHLTSITDPEGHVTGLSYDKNGHLTTISDPAGRGSLHLSYDPATNRLVSVSDWLSPPRVVRYAYDTKGRLSTVTDRDGQVTRYAYDGDSIRLKTITDARGDVALTVDYDSEGRVVRECNARTVRDGKCFTFVYQSNPDGSRVMIQHLPPSGFEPSWQPVVTHEYDRFARLVRSSTRPSSTDGEKVTTYAYDANDDQIVTSETASETSQPSPVPVATANPIEAPSVPDPADAMQLGISEHLVAMATEVSRDPFGRVTGLTIPDDSASTSANLTPGRWVIAYDQEDHPTRIDSPGRNGGPSAVTTLRYDPVGNLVEVDGSDGESTYYTYDERDALIEMRESSGSDLKFAYDDRGYVSRMEASDPKANRHVAVSYLDDGLGRLRRAEEYPNWPSKDNPSIVEYSYGADGHATAYKISG